VWKLKETYVRPIGSARGNKGKGKASAQTEAQTGAKSPPGLPLNGPMTNAGFPTDQPSSTSAGLASAAAEAATVRETIQRQVEAIPGFEVVPDDELDEMLSHPDEEAGLEMLLTGTGHSAWGRFILKGRVRAWDGMASLVKEYAVSIAMRHTPRHITDPRSPLADANARGSPTPAASGSTEAMCSPETSLSGGGATHSPPRHLSATKALSS
jgi:hypothetical protein